MKKYLLAWVCGSVCWVVLAFLFHGVLFDKQFDVFWEKLGGKSPMMALYIIVTPAVMAYMYPKGYEGGPPALEGYKFGVCIGILLITFVAVVLKGLGTEPWLIFVDVGWHVLIEQALVGLVIGVVYGRAPKSPAAATIPVAK